VGESHVPRVSTRLSASSPVIQPGVIFIEVLLPRTQVDSYMEMGLSKPLWLRPFRDPVVVAPVIVIYVADDGGGPGTEFRVEGKRIRLLHHGSAEAGTQLVLVLLPCAEAGYESSQSRDIGRSAWGAFLPSTR